MKKKLLRLFIVMTISITALFALGMTAFADTAGDFTVTATNGGELTAEDYTYADGVLTIISDTPIAISGTTTADRIEVASGVNVNITLAGVNIDLSATGDVFNDIAGYPALKIADNSTGNVTITLADGTTNTLKSGYRCAGLQKNGEYISEAEGKLTIQGGELGTGILDVTGGGAGIGGGDGSDGSNIIISGGVVNATGDGAGIGGGDGGNGTHIIISGGTVTVTGGINAAGIGGGYNGNGTDITISGGIVNVQGGYCAAGIGGGRNVFGGGECDNIVISGGTVTVTGGESDLGNGGPAIGGSGGEYGGSCGTVSITGGVIIAGGGTKNSADLTTAQNAIIIDATAGTATVYGSPTITDDFTLPEGYTLVIPEGSTVTVAKGATFTNNGTVTNNGRFTCRGAFVNGENAILENNLLFTSFGDFENNGTIANNNDLNNSGAFTNNGNITNTSASTFSNEIKGVITNNSTGTITNESGATIENKNFTGSAGIVNNGTIDNSGSISNGANSYGGSVIENNGDITNSGEITNMADCQIYNTSSGTITNESSGTIENNGTIENSGDFVNNGTTEGDGEISGNQPYAEAGDFVITGGNYGTDFTYTDGVLIIKTATSITIANKTPENATTDRIEVATGVSADITLNGVNIDVSGTENACAFKIADNSIGNVTITLADGTTNTLKSGKYCAGLQKNGEYSDALGTLIIYGGDLGTGSLTATGGTYGAGIGGGDGGDGSNITINGGTVTVTGGYSGAGIGGGEEGAGTYITINGGTVTTTGSDDGAGIGGGYYGAGSNITISGGVIKATGGNSAAGIGSGLYADADNIVITAGNVTAIGGEFGAGIGTGMSHENTCSNVYINGGTIIAQGAVSGAGIGGGSGGCAENIVITAGNVTATGGEGAAGIGGGDHKSGNITINGGTITANGGKYGAGIGGGTFADGEIIGISNAIVVATAGEGGNAIGGGYDKTAASLTDTEDSIIIDGTAGTATVYGNPVITDDFTLPEGYTVVIPESSTVTVAEGATFTINGTVTNNGTIENNGTVINSGTIKNKGTITGNPVGGIVYNYDFVITDGTEGEDYTYTGGVLTVIKDGADLTIANKNPSTPTTNRIEIADGVSANITLNGVNIDTSNASGAAFMIADNSTGNVTITLADGKTNTLKSGTDCAGLQKNGEYSETLGKLTITGTGTLTATGGDYGAGIGGGREGSGSNIKISGGTVTATGGTGSAGIGGGYYYGGDGSYITISGGKVTATSSSTGAGIGGGWYGSGSNITISGGTVKAQGYTYGAGIGGGYGGSGSYITISGGEVTATGGKHGAGIGGGDSDDGQDVGCNIKISGGTVTATGGEGGAGIGGGYRGSGSYIEISDGTVTATGGTGGAGIGGGYNGSGSYITISGGSVKAVAGEKLEYDGTTYSPAAIGQGVYWDDGAYYDGAEVTPTDGTDNVYLLELDVDGTSAVTANGKAYPTKHFDENKVYIYLPAKTAQAPNEVTVGNETTKYTYDTTNSKWLVVVDAPEADNSDFTYDGSEKTYSLAESDYYTISGNKQINAGVHTVTVTLNDGYIWSDGETAAKEYEFVINKATPVLEAPTATAITYGEALSNSTLTTGWTWVDGTVIPTVANNGFEANIEVDDSNYDYTGVDGYDETAHTVTRTVAVTVNRAELTVTAESYTVKLGNPFPETLEYTVTGLMGSDTVDSIGADITIGYENGVTPSALGEYAIVVSGETETTNYAINYVNGKLTITEKEIQTISSADNATLTYGETDGNVTATTNGDGAISYTVTTGKDVISVDENGNITILKFGTATVTVKAAETFDYAEATKTITVTVNKKKIALPSADGTEYTYTGTAQTYGVISTDDYTVEGGVQTNAGEYPVTITLNNENYEWDGTLGTYTFVIKQVPVTVTANSYTIKVGEALPTYAYDVTGLVNGETLPIDVTISCTADGKTAGTFDIVVSGDAASDNYTFAYVNGTLTVSAKAVQTVTASDVTLTYGDTDGKITAATDGDGAISYEVATGTDVISVAADGTITALKAGPATVTVKAAETDTYAAATKTVTVTVNKAAVTVTAKSYTIKVGEALPTFEYDVTGLVNNEQLPIDVTISCTADGKTAGTYDIVVSGAATSTNYTFSYANGTLTVSEKEVVAAPTFTPASGTTFTSTQSVTIACATDGATIYYTTDGTAPTTASTLYNGAFTITTTTTIKAIAVKDGMTDSAVVTATYTKKSSGGGGGGGGYTPSYPSTPNNPEINGKSASWTTIADEISKLPIGSETTIELNGNYDVPVDVIIAILANEVKVTFVVDSARSWYVDGARLGNPDAADLSIITIASLNTDTLRGDVGTKFRIDNVNIPAGLKLTFAKTNAGKFANLYKKDGDKLVFVDNVKIDANGVAAFADVSNKGDYVVMLCEYSDRKGDVSNDGVTNALDASAILKDIVELEEAANPVMLDYNGDGRVNALDASSILIDIVNDRI